ncbi:unnamed protein product [Larinioides sclopetarius]|uniref:Uncharacterized protein n=1 Tax=Larinioides sclopetarius TaxID=280406 RepID=A0AAV2BED1_9ARAC
MKSHFLVMYVEEDFPKEGL